MDLEYRVYVCECYSWCVLVGILWVVRFLLFFSLISLTRCHSRHASGIHVKTCSCCWRTFFITIVVNIDRQGVVCAAEGALQPMWFVAVVFRCYAAPDFVQQVHSQIQIQCYIRACSINDLTCIHSRLISKHWLIWRCFGFPWSSFEQAISSFMLSHVPCTL